jgi:hypothetical protein
LRVRLFLIALGAAGLAGVALADPPAPVTPAPVAAPPAKAATADDLARAVFAHPDTREAARPEVTMPTAVDRHFAADSAVASVGYLCGLDSHAFGEGVAGPASSFEREDTFLGAKLSVAIR